MKQACLAAATYKTLVEAVPVRGLLLAGTYSSLHYCVGSGVSVYSV
jgi:hypothetical protein